MKIFSQFQAFLSSVLLLFDSSGKAQKPENLSALNNLRDLLFADNLTEKWASTDNKYEPWTSFLRAKSFMDANQNEEAIRVLNEIMAMDDLESRHYLQASHALRQLGVKDDNQPVLYGVVVEVGMTKGGGYDLLAAYTDHSARYYNYSGSGIIWEYPDDSLNKEIEAVLQHGRAILPKIGLWENPRPAPVKKDIIRLNMLTSHGLTFGEALMDVMYADPVGSGLTKASVALMMALVKKGG